MVPLSIVIISITTLANDNNLSSSNSGAVNSIQSKTVSNNDQLNHLETEITEITIELTAKRTMLTKV